MPPRPPQERRIRWLYPEGMPNRNMPMAYGNKGYEPLTDPGPPYPPNDPRGPTGCPPPSGKYTYSEPDRSGNRKVIPVPEAQDPSYELQEPNIGGKPRSLQETETYAYPDDQQYSGSRRSRPVATSKLRRVSYVAPPPLEAQVYSSVHSPSLQPPPPFSPTHSIQPRDPIPWSQHTRQVEEDLERKKEMVEAQRAGVNELDEQIAEATNRAATARSVPHPPRINDPYGPQRGSRGFMADSLRRQMWHEDYTPNDKANFLDENQKEEWLRAQETAKRELAKREDGLRKSQHHVDDLGRGGW